MMVLEHIHPHIASYISIICYDFPHHHAQFPVKFLRDFRFTWFGCRSPWGMLRVALLLVPLLLTFWCGRFMRLRPLFASPPAAATAHHATSGRKRSQASQARSVASDRQEEASGSSKDFLGIYDISVAPSTGAIAAAESQPRVVFQCFPISLSQTLLL